jgi:hypothetical protein
LERKMHGTVIQFEKARDRSRNKLGEAQAELAVARQKLVEAVGKRAPEDVLRPLRNRVGILLEKIETLHSVDRFRR